MLSIQAADMVFDGGALNRRFVSVFFVVVPYAGGRTIHIYNWELFKRHKKVRAHEVFPTTTMPPQSFPAQKNGGTCYSPHRLSLMPWNFFPLLLLLQHYLLEKKELFNFWRITFVFSFQRQRRKWLNHIQLVLNRFLYFSSQTLHLWSKVTI